jgi:hypothetical protein
MEYVNHGPFSKERLGEQLIFPDRYSELFLKFVPPLIFLEVKDGQF